VAILSDITGRKAHEAALSESNRRFGAALANMAEGLCMVDAEARVLVVNRRFAEMFGVPSADAMAGLQAAQAWKAARDGGRYPADLMAQVKEDQRSLIGQTEPLSVVREGRGRGRAGGLLPADAGRRLGGDLFRHGRAARC
jgi:PAS domain-containing protein